MPKCWKCNASIEYLITLKGHRIPVDRDPKEVLVRVQDMGYQYPGSREGDSVLFMGYTSHVKTCPVKRKRLNVPEGKLHTTQRDPHGHYRPSASHKKGSPKPLRKGKSKGWIPRKED